MIRDLLSRRNLKFNEVFLGRDISYSNFKKIFTNKVLPVIIFDDKTIIDGNSDIINELNKRGMK